jgi:ubiquinone/menaquinone biosynthesis C-methylase UbiE
MRRLGLFFTQVLFALSVPWLLIPSLASLRISRWIVAYCFGKRLSQRYQKIIDMYAGTYGAAMEAGMRRAGEMMEREASTVLDCGTGTGFVARQATGLFPDAHVHALEYVPAMLERAREGCAEAGADVTFVRGDSFDLPVRDGSVDVVLAQNTIACLREFSRVCRKGGCFVFVDTSAGWVTGPSGWLVRRTGLFETVEAKRVDLGFYVVARR